MSHNFNGSGAGVRGKRVLVRHRTDLWDDAPGSYRFEPFTNLSLRLAD